MDDEEPFDVVVSRFDLGLIIEALEKWAEGNDALSAFGDRDEAVFHGVKAREIRALSKRLGSRL